MLASRPALPAISMMRWGRPRILSPICSISRGSKRVSSRPRSSTSPCAICSTTSRRSLACWRRRGGSTSRWWRASTRCTAMCGCCAGCCRTSSPMRFATTRAAGCCLVAAGQGARSASRCGTTAPASRRTSRRLFLTSSPASITPAPPRSRGWVWGLPSPVASRRCSVISSHCRAGRARDRSLR